MPPLTKPKMSLKFYDHGYVSRTDSMSDMNTPVSGSERKHNRMRRASIDQSPLYVRAVDPAKTPHARAPVFIPLNWPKFDCRRPIVETSSVATRHASQDMIQSKSSNQVQPTRTIRKTSSVSSAAVVSLPAITTPRAQGTNSDQSQRIPQLATAPHESGEETSTAGSQSELVANASSARGEVSVKHQASRRHTSRTSRTSALSWLHGAAHHSQETAEGEKTKTSWPSSTFWSTSAAEIPMHRQPVPPTAERSDPNPAKNERQQRRNRLVRALEARVERTLHEFELDAARMGLFMLDETIATESSRTVQGRLLVARSKLLACLGEHEKAGHSFEKALDNEPSNSHLRQHLTASCKHIEYSRFYHIRPRTPCVKFPDRRLAAAAQVVDEQQSANGTIETTGFEQFDISDLVYSQMELRAAILNATEDGVVATRAIGTILRQLKKTQRVSKRKRAAIREALCDGELNEESRALLLSILPPPPREDYAMMQKALDTHHGHVEAVFHFFAGKGEILHHDRNMMTKEQFLNFVRACGIDVVPDVVLDTFNRACKHIHGDLDIFDAVEEIHALADNAPLDASTELSLHDFPAALIRLAYESYHQPSLDARFEMLLDKNVDGDCMSAVLDSLRGRIAETMETPPVMKALEEADEWLIVAFGGHSHTCRGARTTSMVFSKFSMEDATMDLSGWIRCLDLMHVFGNTLTKHKAMQIFLHDMEDADDEDAHQQLVYPEFRQCIARITVVKYGGDIEETDDNDFVPESFALVLKQFVERHVAPMVAKMNGSGKSPRRGALQRQAKTKKEKIEATHE